MRLTALLREIALQHWGVDTGLMDGQDIMDRTTWVGLDTGLMEMLGLVTRRARGRVRVAVTITAMATFTCATATLQVWLRILFKSYVQLPLGHDIWRAISIVTCSAVPL